MKGTLFALAALLTAAPLRAQAPQYGDLDYECTKTNTCRVDKTYVDMTVPKLKAEQTLRDLEYQKYLDDCKAKGCLTFAQWQAQQGQTTQSSQSGTTAGKTKPHKGATGGKTKPSGTGTTTTTGTGTTGPTTTTSGEDTRTPLQKQWEQQQSQQTGTGTTSPLTGTKVDPNAVTNTTQQTIDSKSEEFAPKEQQTVPGGGTPNLTVDPKKDQKDLLTGAPDKKSDLQTSAPPPESDPDLKKPRKNWFSRMFGRKDDKPITTGPIEGKPAAEKGKDFGNMVGGGKFAAYSGLLAAMFLTGPGALAGVVLFGTIGFFAGYWVTKKNG